MTNKASLAQYPSDQAPLQLTGPDGLASPATYLEVLPPSFNHPIEGTIPQPIENSSASERTPSIVAHGIDTLDPWHNLRIWNLPYGVWFLSNAEGSPQPICHVDPTGMAPASFSSHKTDAELTLYFARSSLGLYDPSQRFEAKVRLVPNQVVDFDFAREGGNTGYGNMVRTNLLRELPQAATETRHELPMAARPVVEPPADVLTLQPPSDDGDAISNLIRCSDLDPSVFSDRLRISFDSHLVVQPAELLSNVRLCQIAIEVDDRRRMTDKWTLDGRLKVDSPGGTFVLKDRFELEVDVAILPTSDDRKHKVLVLNETGPSLQVKLQNPQLVDNTIYRHPLFAYLNLLSKPTEGTIRLTDVKLKLNGAKMDDACTAGVSEIQINFIRE